MHAGAEGSDAVHVTGLEEHFAGEDRGNPQAFAHAAVDAGADLVVASGPHVLRGMEFYHRRLIAYSLGNFAGYHNFTGGGNLSLSGVLRVTLAEDGTFVTGRLVSLRLDGDGRPVPDPSHDALDLVAGLSRADFGRRAARFTPAGVIRPRDDPGRDGAPEDWRSRRPGPRLREASRRWSAGTPVGGAAARRRSRMSFSVEGKYFEACSCEVSCPCIWLGPATEDACDVFFAWHVTKGEKDGVDLSGLNAAMAVHTPKVMTEGNWQVALYLDDKADPEPGRGARRGLLRGSRWPPCQSRAADRRGGRREVGSDLVRRVGRRALGAGR